MRMDLIQSYFITSYLVVQAWMFWGKLNKRISYLFMSYLKQTPPTSLPFNHSEISIKLKWTKSFTLADANKIKWNDLEKWLKNFYDVCLYFFLKHIHTNHIFLIEFCFTSCIHVHMSEKKVREMWKVMKIFPLTFVLSIYKK